ncbi:MAG: nodulation protein NfeD [Deltaproteobacteria bacterium]|nr:nodulation protein NfeD [Deltaproteobacteria bacterium]MBZ0220655.1 nodulation protein NfeD [Deltaproteobacteria bacterium]
MANLFRPFLLLAAAILIQAFPSYSSAKEILYVKAEGVVNPVMAGYLLDNFEDAAERDAEAVIIQLDTPGGLDLSMRDIVKAMLASEVPVVVYVAPAGSRAGSAGVFITYSADIAAMAPGTNIGSAHPVSMGGQMDETMAEKVENDAVAYIKGIAAKRGRNAEWAELAVRESKNITAEEALNLGVINIVAASRDELIQKLDGMKVETITGERALSTADLRVVEVEMDLRYRILGAISNPNVAYILMILGLIGIYFELSNPGAVYPGVIGAISLILAFYAFQTLPVNYAGFILIGLGVVFFILELMVVSYGLLAIAGVVSLLLGSLMLFDSPAPYFRISIWVILPAVILMTAVVIGAMLYAVRVHRRRPVSGTDLLVGSIGVASDDLGGEKEGSVYVEGEYWNAVSDVPVKGGEKVRVVEVKGLLLKVTKA